MIAAFAVLMLFQLAGEFVVSTLRLPIPGPVVGMSLLFLALILRRSAPAPLRTTASGLLQHLSLLFVPAGVGVIAYFALIQDEWARIGLTLILSTILTMGITALTVRYLAERVCSHQKGAEREE